jgi:hypothetical protein
VFLKVYRSYPNKPVCIFKAIYRTTVYGPAFRSCKTRRSHSRRVSIDGRNLQISGKRYTICNNFGACLSVCNQFECVRHENFLTQKSHTLENEGKLILVTRVAVSCHKEVKADTFFFIESIPLCNNISFINYRQVTTFLTTVRC